MSKLRVHGFSISIDGFGAGPNQDLSNPLGVRGPELFDWFFHTRTWQQMHGNGGGEVHNAISCRPGSSHFKSRRSAPTTADFPSFRTYGRTG